MCLKKQHPFESTREFITHALHNFYEYVSFTSGKILDVSV